MKDKSQSVYPITFQIAGLLIVMITSSFGQISDLPTQANPPDVEGRLVDLDFLKNKVHRQINFGGSFFTGGDLDLRIAEGTWSALSRPELVQRQLAAGTDRAVIEQFPQIIDGNLDTILVYPGYDKSAGEVSVSGDAVNLVLGGVPQPPGAVIQLDALASFAFVSPASPVDSVFAVVDPTLGTVFGINDSVLDAGEGIVFGSDFNLRPQRLTFFSDLGPQSITISGKDQVTGEQVQQLIEYEGTGGRQTVNLQDGLIQGRNLISVTVAAGPATSLRILSFEFSEHVPIASFSRWQTESANSSQILRIGELPWANGSAQGSELEYSDFIGYAPYLDFVSYATGSATNDYLDGALGRIFQREAGGSVVGWQDFSSRFEWSNSPTVEQTYNIADFRLSDTYLTEDDMDRHLPSATFYFGLPTTYQILPLRARVVVDTFKKNPRLFRRRNDPSYGIWANEVLEFDYRYFFALNFGIEEPQNHPSEQIQSFLSQFTGFDVGSISSQGTATTGGNIQIEGGDSVRLAVINDRQLNPDLPESIFPRPIDGLVTISAEEIEAALEVTPTDQRNSVTVDGITVETLSDDDRLGASGGTFGVTGIGAANAVESGEAIRFVGEQGLIPLFLLHQNFDGLVVLSGIDASTGLPVQSAPIQLLPPPPGGEISTTPLNDPSIEGVSFEDLEIRVIGTSATTSIGFVQAIFQPGAGGGALLPSPRSVTEYSFAPFEFESRDNPLYDEAAGIDADNLPFTTLLGKQFECRLRFDRRRASTDSLVASFGRSRNDLTFQIRPVDSFRGFAAATFGLNFIDAGPALIGAAAADPDQDGYSNLEEFALRTDPQDSSSLPSFAPQIIGNDLTLEVPTRGLAGSTITYEFQYSFDMTNWVTIDDADTNFVVNRTDPDLAVITNLVPAGSFPSLMFRVRIINNL